VDCRKKRWEDPLYARGAGDLLKILKFGGSCLTGSLESIVDIIKGEPADKIVVLSALPGVTDALHEVARSWSADRLPKLERVHFECARSIQGEEFQKRTIKELKGKIEELRKTLNEKKDERSVEYVIAFGERLSVKILESALISRGVDAESFDADDLGMIARRGSGNSELLLEETAENLKKLLPLIEGGKVPIITGYFGRDEDGFTTTFGRGGSDYSATAMAYCLDADAVEVWKDVNGFMSADPKIVKDARHLEGLSYEEASELAYFGAKVIHPRGIEPAMRKGIPIIVKDVRKPQEPGTIISGSYVSDGKIKSISLKRGLAIVKLYSLGMAYRSTYARATDTMDSMGINVYAISTSQANFAMVIHEEEAERARKSIEKAVEVDKIEVMKGMGMVCAVGAGMGHRVGVASSVFDVVRDAGINVEMISEGASDAALNLVVKSEFEEEAVRALHEALIGER
jgi:aspartate kinase